MTITEDNCSQLKMLPVANCSVNANIGFPVTPRPGLGIEWQIAISSRI